MRTRALLVSLFSLGSVSAQSGWVVHWTAVSPPTRELNLLTFDLARGVTVLFSGWAVGNDTWEWNGSTWVQRSPTTSPPARQGAAHAYDLVRNRVVMFGGFHSPGGGIPSMLLDDTWEYDGNDWTLVATSSAPSPRQMAAMAFDVVRGDLVLFGGTDVVNGFSHALGDMWAWNGTVWTRLLPAHLPMMRWAHGMTTDFANNGVLLHGGYWNVPLGDTWRWNGADWTPVASIVQPPAVSGCGLTYDWLRRVPVRFGGQPLNNQTWLYAGNTWVLDPWLPAPPWQSGCALAFDVFRGRTVFFNRYGATWEYRAPDVATWLPFGDGCAGSVGVPLLRPIGTSRPVVGATLQLEVLSLPNSGFAAIATGFSATSWSGGALPASLAPLGMPNCTLLADPQSVFVTPIVGGRATRAWLLPNVAALVGTRFVNQAFVVDPGVNALGAVVSNAGAGIVGTL